MTNEELNKNLDSLYQKDIYSLILFALFKIKEIPEYSTLSELVYILDKESFLKFFEYFGGCTIKVPTISELKNVINALLLYNYVNFENMSYATACRQLNKDALELKQIKSIYTKISEILNKYDFTRSVING